MKLSTKIAKLMQERAKRIPPRPAPQKARKSTRRRKALIAICVLLAAGGSWAVLEFLVWSRLPPELVGNWQVQDGPMKGGSFDFSRNGNLEISSNQGHVVKARVAVQGKNLLTTTKNPSTSREETHASIIQQLTADSLILELEQGDVLRMVQKIATGMASRCRLDYGSLQNGDSFDPKCT